MRKQNLFFFIGMLLVFVFQNISAQWITVNERYATIAQDNISNLYWKDSSTIFASGMNNMIIKSENGGANWQYSNFGINQTTNSKNVNTIKFFNANTGFAASSFLYKTTNGGSNWNVVSSSYFDGYTFINENIVYAYTIGNTFRNLYKSTNGGLNWNQTDTVTPHFSKIIFINESTGYFNTENKIFKTTNSGTNWFYIWSGTSLSDFAFQDAAKGVIIRYNGVLITVDGGQTWSSLYASSPLYLRSCLLFRNDTLICSGATTVDELYFSTNSGVSFTHNVIAMPIPYFMYQSVCSFWNKGKCAIAHDKRIFKSTDFGSTFTDIGIASGSYIAFNSIYMFNPNEIFLGSDSYLWKTTNGGVNWSMSNQNLPLSQIQFINYNSGYALSGSRVKYTIDHGDNWFSLPAVTNISGTNITYNLLKVVNESSIFLGLTSQETVAPGTIYITNSIYSTTNSGTNWNKKLSVVSTYGSQGSQNKEEINDAFFINANTGFCIYNMYASDTHNPNVFQESGKILKTVNGGNNWSTIIDSDSSQGGEIYFINQNTGYFSLYSNFQLVSKRGIYKTTNCGANWNKITDFYSDKFIFTDENTAFTPGYGSSDGGVTWINQFTPYSPNDIKFINNHTGFIVGNEGVIYKTTNAGGLNVSITQTSTSVPDKFSLSQNYPNPFNPFTKINYEIKSSAFVSMKVFDSQGKEVATLVNEKQNAGSYSVNFNSAEFSLPSGIYFYTLKAGEFKETKKMVLVK